MGMLREWQRLGRRDNPVDEDVRYTCSSFFSRLMLSLLDPSTTGITQPLTYAANSCYCMCGPKHTPCGLPYKHSWYQPCRPDPEQEKMPDGKGFSPEDSFDIVLADYGDVGSSARAEAIHDWFHNVYYRWLGDYSMEQYEDALSLVRLFFPLLPEEFC